MDRSQVKSMDATTTVTYFTSFIDDIGDVLASVIPSVLVIGAALIGLAFGIRYAKKWIGRK